MTTQPRLEGNHIGAHQAFEDFAAPWQPGQDLYGRERDVEKEADTNIGAHLTQHRRHQLQLIIVDPRKITRSEGLRCLFGKPAVHLNVRMPPVAVELRWADGIVIERPDGGVGETEIEVVDVVLVQPHRSLFNTIVDERLGCIVCSSGPTDPAAASFLQERSDGTDEAAGTGLPAGLRPTQRQSVGDDNNTFRHRSSLPLVSFDVGRTAPGLLL